jgi:hypothetical protein
LLSALETLVHLQTDLLRDAASQERHLSTLRRFKETQLQLDPKYIGHQVTGRQREEIRQQWEREIRNCANFFETPATGSLKDALENPFWLGWEYEKAYPLSFGFLSQAAENAKLRLSSCRVCYYDPSLPNPKPGREPGGLHWVVSSGTGSNKETIADKLWKAVTVGNGANTPRTICVQDMSPSVGAVLLATTPRYVRIYLGGYLGC